MKKQGLAPFQVIVQQNKKMAPNVFEAIFETLESNAKSISQMIKSDQIFLQVWLRVLIKICENIKIGTPHHFVFRKFYRSVNQNIVLNIPEVLSVFLNLTGIFFILKTLLFFSIKKYKLIS